MSLGQIVAFTNYLLTTMAPLILMTHALDDLGRRRRLGQTDRIALLDTEPDVQDAPIPVALPEAVNGRIVFENVSFQLQRQAR